MKNIMKKVLIVTLITLSMNSSFATAIFTYGAVKKAIDDGPITVLTNAGLATITTLTGLQLIKEGYTVYGGLLFVLEDNEIITPEGFEAISRLDIAEQEEVIEILTSNKALSEMEDEINYILE